jgi:hypothetical protein
MKLNWKIALGILALVGLSLFLFWPSDDAAKKAVAETRRALHQQGFKTDLTEFNFFTSDEFRARESALTALGHNVRRMSPSDQFEMMSATSSDAAVVVWKQEKLEGRSGHDLWSELRESLSQDQSSLDAACEAALSGPIRFNLDASGGNNMLLPHVAGLKRLAQTLAGRAVLDLHDDKKNSGWTNLLALTRLVTVWQPEPAEVSHLVRLSLATIAYNTTWQLLQEKSWSDEQLAELQREWESADFFRGLPETAAFARASAVSTCQLERTQPLSSGVTFKGIISSPLSSWSQLRYYLRQRSYRNHGSYEDEKALLLHYRDREIQLSKAVQSPNWSAMRALPGVTNVVPFKSKYSSRTQSMLNMRQISLAFAGQGGGLLGKAAEAETRRRIILTAIALERQRGRNGSYPKTLQELAPEFLEKPIVDFMDGNPFCYRLMSDGNFLLYSVGLDCLDNNGEMPRKRMSGEFPMPMNLRTSASGDIVWPRPASANEVETQLERDKKAEQERTAQILLREAEREKEEESLRKITVEKLLAMKSPRLKEPIYQGKPLSKLLSNGTGKNTLDDLFTLKQIITGSEPDLATFELPIRYDVVTNIGFLQLLVDVPPEESTSSCAEFQGCARATNGNCRLIWNTTFDPPGQHAVQAQLYLEREDSNQVRGPVTPFYSSNLCQFNAFYSNFDAKGATLYAKLPEPNGIYTIELKTPDGGEIKTFTGSTSNGVIKVNWNLIDAHGKRFTNDSFESTFHITLPDSGRSQTMKGQ